MNDTKKIEKGNDRVRKMVRLLGKEVMTRQGLMAGLGLKKEGIRNFRVSYWYPARDAEYVRMVYAGSPNCPIQAYKLTDKGKAYFEDLKKQEEEEKAVSEKD